MFRKSILKAAWRLTWVLAAAFTVAACEKDDGGEYVDPGPPDQYVWRELPLITPEQEPFVATHYADFPKGEGRNFTLLYDTFEKVSYWVAYPLHKVYLGTYKRLDNFIYDPAFPKATQMPLTNSGYGWDSGYDRGHQIPSADRTSSRDANDETFYITNMTPQNSTLNQGEWASLEAWVRARVQTGARSDTLYVVTGCMIEDEEGNVSHITKNGVKGAVPTAYYKVLLRTKSGKAKYPTSDDAMCIGVCMPNVAPGDTDSWENYITSVTDIEQLTGFTFFPAISEAVKSTVNLYDWSLHDL